jgi:hypothetical protein
VTELARLHARVNRLEELGVQIRLGIAIIMFCGAGVCLSAWWLGTWALKHAMVDAMHSPDVAAEIYRIAHNESK